MLFSTSSYWRPVKPPDAVLTAKSELAAAAEIVNITLFILKFLILFLIII